MKNKINEEIKKILLSRLFTLYRKITSERFEALQKETSNLINRIQRKEVTHQIENDFIAFFETNGEPIVEMKIVQMEEIPSIDIPRAKNPKRQQKLYRWGCGKKNELIFRYNGKEENERLKYLPAGFYFVSTKIDKPGSSLYYVSENLQRGKVTYHKTVAGEQKTFTQRKNKGKIYRLTDYKDILKEESRKFATSDIVYSCYRESNDFIFPKVLKLHLKPKSRVLDVTYGTGVFWKNVPQDDFDLTASDLTTGIDARNLPFDGEEFDCVVFDPPQIFSTSGTVHKNNPRIEHLYKNNQSRESIASETDKKYHDAMLDLYYKGSKEAFRVLKHGGILVIKCQDAVCRHQQRLTHVEIINELLTYGFSVLDLFVVMQKVLPITRKDLKQRHARKNHSYFLVFRKHSKRK